MLKVKRSDLKRDVYATPYHLGIGIFLVLWGLLGNILLSPTVLEFFVSGWILRDCVCIGFDIVGLESVSYIRHGHAGDVSTPGAISLE